MWKRVVGFGTELTVSTSGSASVGIVAIDMNVHSTFGICIITRNIPANSGGARFGLLFESDCTFDIRVTTDDANWKNSISPVTRRSMEG
jgi:hypothetical protein